MKLTKLEQVLVVLAIATVVVQACIYAQRPRRARDVRDVALYHGPTELVTNAAGVSTLTFSDLYARGDVKDALWVTNTSKFTNFLVLRNRAWLKMGNSCVIRVTDEEWAVLTNAYRTNLTREPLSFYY